MKGFEAEEKACKITKIFQTSQKVLTRKKNRKRDKSERRLLMLVNAQMMKPFDSVRRTIFQMKAW